MTFFMHVNCCGCFRKDTSGKDTITADNSGDDDDDILLLSDASEESVGGRMVSTPLFGHPAAIDMSDVISSIHGIL